MFVFVPIIPEILERLQVGLKIPDTDDVLYEKLNDKVNDAYGFMYALTNFVAPLLGSNVFGVEGMRSTFDIIALSDLGYGVILFIFNCGIFFISEDRTFKEELKKYSSAEDADDDVEPQRKLSVPGKLGYDGQLTRSHSSLHSRHKLVHEHHDYMTSK